ncbi:hypothetical protein CTI12_AA277900 [Artemisia annua]|uniref:Fanconi Anaemia group E protein C-terminal domain-containing protein n=1 Tax=Artemisia annua TaxID=35608 RepID=A0A2U1NEB3_ARTAN|nr:hypothetical protein CTI12_AA277900 [Artemisia annua]
MQPTTHADVINSSSSSSKQRFMWLQTLPDIVQARIISFLTYDHAKFNKQDLTKLARDVLSNSTSVDYWVKKAAQQLLDVVSDSNYKWVTSLNLDSEEETLEGDFGGVPEWLKNVASESDSVLPWLPVSVDELNLREPNVTCEDDDDLMEDVEEGKNGSLGTVDTQKKLVHHEVVPVDHETEETAACLKTRLLNMESSLKAAELVDDIHKLCLKTKKDSLTVLNLIEPWNANDEIVPVLLSGLLDEKEDDFILTSNILCSILLPKFLVLEKPASRVLLTAAIPYCKVHHKAAVYAVLFPLILHKDGINNPICDVITRIIKECLHPAHASAFCQKLLCEREVDENEYICIPSYQHLVSKNMVWTEPLFNLFQNILNHNVHLTQDSVDQLVFHVQEASRRFPASLKFANFLLCFVSKCAPLLKVHKVALSEAVGNTSSFLTKSILSKLDSI